MLRLIVELCATKQTRAEQTKSKDQDLTLIWERSAVLERLELLEPLEPPGLPINCCLEPDAF